MLELDQVSKRLGNFQLRNITIQIPTGYLCGLAGENGAGKTSLLHMLLGLYRPDSGTVRIDGKYMRKTKKKYGSRQVLFWQKICCIRHFPFCRTDSIMAAFIMDTRRSVLWKN